MSFLQWNQYVAHAVLTPHARCLHVLQTLFLEHQSSTHHLGQEMLNLPAAVNSDQQPLYISPCCTQQREALRKLCRREQLPCKP